MPCAAAGLTKGANPLAAGDTRCVGARSTPRVERIPPGDAPASIRNSPAIDARL